jgi:outer membrane protein OmpA-like peptidoglycan-associated protein
MLKRFLRFARGARVPRGRFDFRPPCLFFVALAQSSSIGCGSGQPCRPETWTGTCRLETVTKVREAELPLPSVVLEAIYRPESTPGTGPVLLLPNVRREFVALARYEDALRAHVMAYPSALCYVNPPPPGQCTPGPMVVEVPEFDGTRAAAEPEDTGPKGCAQIDETSTQDRIAREQTEAEAVKERFQFGDGSADLPEDAAAAATTVAARMKQDPSIQCLGVVGQFVRGENLEIAIARARAVRQLLIQQGVEPERLITFTLDRPMSSASGTADPSSSSERRVTLTILLKLAPKP